MIQFYEGILRKRWFIANSKFFTLRFVAFSSLHVRELKEEKTSLVFSLFRDLVRS